MSWAAHDIEPYLLRAKLGARISLPFCLLGSYSPDLATKWLVYGIGAFGHNLRVPDPVQFHRGWPGVGFTHSFAFGALVGLILYWVTKSRVIALSFVIGQALHVLSDMLDSVGVMAGFPFSLTHVSTGAYAYAGELGRLPDAHAYYGGLGGVCDLIMVILFIPFWRTLTLDFFDREVLTTDPAFIWLRAKAGLLACRTVYLTSIFFGVTSVIGWFTWALVWHRWHLDLSPGGPRWVPTIHVP
jgi:membrane-bound metal-dependent hydrolase YbcI (DUF457 family)